MAISLQGLKKSGAMSGGGCGLRRISGSQWYERSPRTDTWLFAAALLYSGLVALGGRIRLGMRR